MIYERTRAAVQRRIDAGLSEFDIGGYHYWVGLPVTLLHNVECCFIHQAPRRGNYYQRELILYSSCL